MYACFNPRPPFPEGDAYPLKGDSMATNVSIHALRFQRAMHDFTRTIEALFKFQSTPSVSRGRCHRLPAQRCVASRVSIHALRFQRAMRRGDLLERRMSKFQSTPSVSRGRCNVAVEGKAGKIMFQSTPSVSRGRCWKFCKTSMACARFNPRPPFPEGDALFSR